MKLIMHVLNNVACALKICDMLATSFGVHDWMENGTSGDVSLEAWNFWDTVLPMLPAGHDSHFF